MSFLGRHQVTLSEIKHFTAVPLYVHIDAEPEGVAGGHLNMGLCKQGRRQVLEFGGASVWGGGG